MKQIFIGIFFSALIQFGYCQDSIVFTTKYRLTRQMDSSKPGRTTNDIMLLAISRKGSTYFSYLRQLGMRYSEQKYSNESQAGASNVVQIDDLSRANSYIDKEQEIIAVNYSLKKVIISDKLGSLMPYFTEAELEAPMWSLASETDSILGQHCQKATTFFKGRNYTAWFAPGIPFQMGPWLLNGLPGLILKAVDDRNEVSFECIELNTSETETAIFVPYKNPQPIASKKLKELKKIFVSDYYTFAREIEGSPFTVTDRDGKPRIPKPKPYNPIDLTN